MVVTVSASTHTPTHVPTPHIHPPTLTHPHPHTHTHTHPPNLHVGVKLCKFQHNVAGCDGERKVKLDLGLPRGEGCALCLQPNAPFVLQFNCILHCPVAVIQVHHTDLPGGEGWREGRGGDGT